MKAKDYVHDGVLHQDIMNNLTAYLRVQPELSEFFQRLRSSGKKVAFVLLFSLYYQFVFISIYLNFWSACIFLFTLSSLYLSY